MWSSFWKGTKLAAWSLGFQSRDNRTDESRKAPPHPLPRSSNFCGRPIVEFLLRIGETGGLFSFRLVLGHSVRDYCASRKLNLVSPAVERTQCNPLPIPLLTRIQPRQRHWGRRLRLRKGRRLAVHLAHFPGSGERAPLTQRHDLHHENLRVTALRPCQPFKMPLPVTKSRHRRKRNWKSRLCQERSSATGRLSVRTSASRQKPYF